MTSLVSTDDVRAQVSTGMTDSQLQAVIDRVEEEITKRIGAPYEDASTTITEIVKGKSKSVYLKRPVDSVSSVTEYSQLSDTTGTALTENEEFYVWPDQGRLERIGGIWGNTAVWGRMVKVVYVPQDQRKQRKGVIIDLVRLELNRTAMYQESVGGEFSFTAPNNWEKERQRIIKRICFTNV